jgi:uncharacterized protein (DUF983 family)
MEKKVGEVKRFSFAELIGHQIEEICPKCKKFKLFTNIVGRKWCTDTNCNYHVDENSKQMNPPILSKLSFVAYNDLQQFDN